MRTTLHMVAAISTCLLVGVPSWFLFDRDTPVQRWSGAIEPLEIEPGSDAVIDWTIKSGRTCKGHVRRQITDSAGVVWDFNIVHAVAEKRTRDYHLIRPITIPRGIACGPANYVAHLEFVCNWFQKAWPIKETSIPVPFTVKCP